HAITEQKPFDLELRFKGEDGKEIWVRAVGNPIVQNGRVVQVRGTFQDISHIHEVEVALQESEVLFQSLADNVSGLIWMTAPNGKGLYFNHRWIEFTGRSTPSSTSTPWQDLIHADDWREAETRLLQALVDHRPYERTFRLRRHDGEYRWI